MELLLFLGLLALIFVLSWYFSTYGSENEKRIRRQNQFAAAMLPFQ